MIRSITSQKPFEEILNLLDHATKIFIIGCGTCTTMTRTGGQHVSPGGQLRAKDGLFALRDLLADATRAQMDPKLVQWLVELQRLLAPGVCWSR